MPSLCRPYETTKMLMNKIQNKRILTAFLFIAVLFGSSQTFPAEIVKESFEIKNIDPKMAEIQLKKLASPDGKIAVKGNTIYVIDRKENVQRMQKVLEEIDRAENTASGLAAKNREKTQVKMEIVPLKYMPANEMIDILEEIYRDGSGYGAGGETALTGEVKFREMAEQNSVIVMANENDQKVVKAAIVKLDVKSSGSSSDLTTRVIFLQNSIASEVMRTLDKMKDEMGGGRNSRSSSGKWIAENTMINSLDSSNSLVLVGPRSEIGEVAGLIQQIDQAPMQVLIELMILEVSLKNGDSLGVEWNYKKEKPQQTNEATANFGIRPLFLGGNNGFFYSYESEYFSAILQAIQESGDVRIVSAPQILVANNQEAEIVIGDSVVINKETLEIPTADATTPIVRTTRDYIDVGLRLHLLPKISEDDVVLIDLLQEVNDIKDSGIPGFPEIAKRSMRTKILVKDRESAVLGGLISKKTSDVKSKIKILGDLPVIGRIFRKTETEVKDTELVLFITAYVIDDHDTLRQVTEEQKMKLREMRLKLFRDENSK